MQVVYDCPAYDFLCDAIEHGSQVQPALTGGDIGDVTGPLVTRPLGGEVAFHPVKEAERASSAAVRHQGCTPAGQAPVL